MQMRSATLLCTCLDCVTGLLDSSGLFGLSGLQSPNLKLLPDRLDCVNGLIDSSGLFGLSGLQSPNPRLLPDAPATFSTTYIKVREPVRPETAWLQLKPFHRQKNEQL